MSTSEVSTRRSRRTPTTPSRYGRDFVMKSGVDMKKEPKDTADVNLRKSPRGSNTAEHVEQAVKNKKQTPMKKTPLKLASKKQTSPEETTTATLIRTTRRGSKRIANLEEIAQEDLSEKKRQKPNKGMENKINKNKEQNAQKKKMMSAETAVGDVESKTGQEHQEEEMHISKLVKQAITASVSSLSKDQPPAEPPKSQSVSQPSGKATASRPQSSKDIPSEENQAGNMSSTSSVFKALKEAIVTYRSTPGESSSKDSPVSSVVKVPMTASKTPTAKVDVISKLNSKDKPAVTVLKVQKLPSKGQATETQTPKTQPSANPPTKPDSPKGTPSKGSSNSSSPVPSSPIKKIQVNIIRGNQSGHVGLLAEQSQKQNSNSVSAVKVVSSPRGKKQQQQPLKEYSHPFLVTNDMVSKISLKGRTTSTQTSHDDLQVLMYINKNMITNCALKVKGVTPSKVSKPHFRMTNSSHRTKHSQTPSQFSDLNFMILDAIGREEEMFNECSLSYAGEESSDVDKKIQWMLFGQDLETAMTDTRGGIPSNVVEKGQAEDKCKPKNAKISIESWSLALTVLNPNV